MSNKCSDLAWEADFGGTNRKVVAMRLADHADDEGRGIWPSVERIAAQCNTSERTVQRVLKDFVAEGLLVIVDEGGRGRGSTRRYDFDMAALKAVPKVKWGDAARAGRSDPKANLKGDTQSPLEPVKGDTGGAKGDSRGSLGCHRVTQTPIEPPEPSNAGAGARPPGPSSGQGQGQRQGQGQEQAAGKGEGGDVNRAGKTARPPREAERLFWKLVKDWPQLRGMPKDRALTAFLKLSPQNQDLALERRDAWIRLVRSQKRQHVPGPEAYCRGALWQDVPAETGASDAAKIRTAPPFGKLWSAARFADLMRPPYGTMPRPTRFQQKILSSGGAQADKARRDRQAKYGWPTVLAMQEAAIRHRRGYRVPPGLEKLAGDFRQVRVGAELWQAWQVLHERRGWPWFDAGRLPDWTYFPAAQTDPGGGADAYAGAAIACFEQAYRSLTGVQAAE